MYNKHGQCTYKETTRINADKKDKDERGQNRKN